MRAAALLYLLFSACGLKLLSDRTPLYCCAGLAATSDIAEAGRRERRGFSLFLIQPLPDCRRGSLALAHVSAHPLR